jgi:hypothetical protein
MGCWPAPQSRRGRWRTASRRFNHQATAHSGVAGHMRLQAVHIVLSTCQEVLLTHNQPSLAAAANWVTVTTAQLHCDAKQAITAHQHCTQGHARQARAARVANHAHTHPCCTHTHPTGDGRQPTCAAAGGRVPSHHARGRQQHGLLKQRITRHRGCTHKHHQRLQLAQLLVHAHERAPRYRDGVAAAVRCTRRPRPQGVWRLQHHSHAKHQVLLALDTLLGAAP